MNKILYAMALGCSFSLIAGSALAHQTESKQESMILKASRVLPHKDGDEFRQTIHEADEENADIEKQITVDHSALYVLLTAQEFDQKAFLDKTKELRELQAETKENRDKAFAAAVEQLTPQERIKLAQALDTQAPHKYVHHHSHKNAAIVKEQNARSGNAPDDQTQ